LYRTKVYCERKCKKFHEDLTHFPSPHIPVTEDNVFSLSYSKRRHHMSTISYKIIIGSKGNIIEIRKRKVVKEKRKKRGNTSNPSDIRSRYINRA